MTTTQQSLLVKTTAECWLSPIRTVRNADRNLPNLAPASGLAPFGTVRNVPADSYIDGSLDTTISMPFAGDYNPYFAADGHTVPNRIEVDFVEVKRA